MKTSTKVEQYLYDSGRIISIRGQHYVPISLVTRIVDSVATDTAFPKAESQKITEEFEATLRAEEEARMPKPVEVPRAASLNAYNTVPYNYFVGPVDGNGNPLRPEEGHYIVQVPDHLDEPNKKAYAESVIRQQTLHPVEARESKVEAVIEPQFDVPTPATPEAIAPPVPANPTLDTGARTESVAESPKAEAKADTKAEAKAEGKSK